MTQARISLLALCLGVAPLAAQDERAPGTAVITLDDTEYTIPIECDDVSRPEAGFGTEPSRITRESTGRTSMVNLRVRQWQETDEVVVTLDRYSAWMPRPTSAGGVLAVEVDMSPTSVVRDGVPVTLTHDMWSSGDRPEGITGVRFEASCTYRDPDAPSFRRLPGGAKP
jgi:hypothetical protein